MYRIGIDLGGTNIAAGIVNSDFKIIAKASVPTVVNEGAERVAKDIAGICDKITKDNGITMDEIESIGIASPGIANSEEGVVEYSCNLPFRKFHICETLSSLTGVASIHVENDANAAAWGEAVAGAAKGTKNSVMITLGTGVGGGIIIDGKVYSGFNFAGAELGHTVIEKDGRPCNCGRKGCWEAYSSATGLINLTKEKIEECGKSGRPTLMNDFVAKHGKVNGMTAFAAMRDGDMAGKEVVDEYIAYLACGLANIVNIFQPEVVSIGGGVSNEGQLLIDLLMPYIKSETYGGEFVKPTDIRIAKLGNDAGIVGAATLGM
ncbi:MAG: ROK family protein [Clostridia bacterium]|nr:ROK family protein [Clostridia bacterium]